MTGTERVPLSAELSLLPLQLLIDTDADTDTEAETEFETEAEAELEAEGGAGVCVCVCRGELPWLQERDLTLYSFTLPVRTRASARRSNRLILFSPDRPPLPFVLC